jgi:bisphosphoglycerate-independent phosphoglycerate mutase (AlkP superfamily)
VPFLFISNENQGSFVDLSSVKSLEPVGILADIAPTIVSELGLKLPSEMTGINLRDSLS